MLSTVALLCTLAQVPFGDDAPYVSPPPLLQAEVFVTLAERSRPNAVEVAGRLLLVAGGAPPTAIGLGIAAGGVVIGGVGLFFGVPPLAAALIIAAGLFYAIPVVGPLTAYFILRDHVSPSGSTWERPFAGLSLAFATLQVSGAAIAGAGYLIRRVQKGKGQVIASAVSWRVGLAQAHGGPGRASLLSISRTL